VGNKYGSGGFDIKNNITGLENRCIQVVCFVNQEGKEIETNIFQRRIPNLVSDASRFSTLLGTWEEEA
jgi:hypothetical protein